ncbi:P-loop containing nucleoside triphosphate hydrolase [Sesbania bispinosa]|nr:P-loop containing nucleoside triphosphate hydrolase [Sesbania bispinosa]
MNSPTACQNFSVLKGMLNWSLLRRELDAVPKPNDTSDSLKPIEFLVSHSQPQQELCDTICNLNAISTSTGLGGNAFWVIFKVEGNHRLPPTTLSPGDMVCVRTCDSRGAVTTSCMQGFVNNLGDDGYSITVALESRHGDSTFSKLFGKNVRIDRIQGLADTLTYERNCEALMLLQKNGLRKKNPSISVVATLFGDGEDVAWLEKNDLADWTEEKLNGKVRSKVKGFLLQHLLMQLLIIWFEKLSNVGLNIVRVGNPARISKTVGSKSLGEIVNTKLAGYREEYERKKSDLRKDLRHCLRDDSLAAGIRQLLKQLSRSLKKKEKQTINEVLSSAQVVLATNTGAADPLIRRLGTFDLVVIDEAGQAIEPSCWIPILQGKRCILAGDQCQLAPVILSRKALEGGLGISLLERASTLHEGILTTTLTTQYRMNNAIASWASKEMYGDC